MSKRSENPMQYKVYSKLKAESLNYNNPNLVRYFRKLGSAVSYASHLEEVFKSCDSSCDNEIIVFDMIKKDIVQTILIPATVESKKKTCTCDCCEKETLFDKILRFITTKIFKEH